MEAALKGEWLTVALSFFKISFTTNSNEERPEPNVGIGVVHLISDYGKQLRVELRLWDHIEGLEYKEIGHSNIDHLNNHTNDKGYYILNINIFDKKSKISNAIRDAMITSSFSENRFVHIFLKREVTDVNNELLHIRENKYGKYYKIYELKMEEKIILPKSPSQSWSWSDYPWQP
jgi:hypothetical protein